MNAVTQILAEVNKTVVTAKNARDAAAAVAVIQVGAGAGQSKASDALLRAHAELQALPWNKRDFTSLLANLIQCLQELAEKEDINGLASRLSDACKGAAMYQEKNGTFTVALSSGKKVNGRTAAEAIDKAIEQNAKIVPDSELLDSKPRTLSELESAIHAAFAVQHKAGMQVGVLLSSAREFLPDNNAWLAWAREKFSIGKAQVYKLVKVADTFGRDKRFSKAPATALYSLAAQGTPEQIEKAAKMAEDGKLTVQAVDLLLNPEPVAKVNAPATTDSLKQSDAPPRVTRMADVPWGDEPSNEKESTGGGAPAQESASSPVVPVQSQADATMADLVREIGELRRQLAVSLQEASALRAERERKPVQSQAPMLPHFLSTDMHIRLGLTHEEAADKDNVRLAARDILKLYRGNAVVTEAITQAMENLLG